MYPRTLNHRPGLKSVNNRYMALMDVTISDQMQRRIECLHTMPSSISRFLLYLRPRLANDIHWFTCPPKNSSDRFQFSKVLQRPLGRMICMQKSRACQLLYAYSPLRPSLDPAVCDARQLGVTVNANVEFLMQI